jgi:flavin reductase (DIM6/NTAB) family NADH-FMN oxidoreductase RutF
MECNGRDESWNGVNDGLQERFREAMASLAGGVAVVTARRADAAPWGLAVTSVASYSADPPSVFFAVGREARSHDPFLEAEEYGVHLLTAGQAAIAETFAGKGEDKFADLQWRWHGEAPRIEGVLAFLHCRRSAAFSHGDHSIIVGEVLDADARHGEPLVYLRRSTGWRLEPPT